MDGKCPSLGGETNRRRETNLRFRRLKLSPSQVYEDIVDVSLLYCHFYSRKPVYNENYRSVDHAVDRFVDATDGRFSCSSLLNHDSKFAVRDRKFITKEHAPSFWDPL